MSDERESSEARTHAERKRKLQGDAEFTADELRHLAEVSQDLASITDFDGYFRLLSPSWERELGWTREELRSKPFIEFVHPDDRDKTHIVEERLQPGVELRSFQNRYLCKDGSVKALRWQGITSAETRRYYMMARVVTHELLARGQAAALDALFEISSDALLQQSEDGGIERWSDAAQELFGHGSEVRGRPVADYLRSADGEAVDLLALEEAAEAAGGRARATVLCADGSTAKVLVAVRSFSDGSTPITGAVATLTPA